MLRDNYETWKCADHDVSLSRPRIMGVLNVTPDSFSDGGENLDAKDAVRRGLEMLDQGADIIDVGGESTRPGFTPVTPEEEAARIVPVVRELVAAGAVVSVDTRHVDVAKICARLGAAIINDVTGFTDPEMVEMAAETEVGCVIMHAGEVAPRATRRSVTLDEQVQRQRAKDDDKPEEDEAADEASKGKEAGPKLPVSDHLEEVMERSARGIANPTFKLSSGNRQFTLPDEGPIMRQVMGFLGDQARTLMRAGVAHERICIDPGAGFGKQADEDVVIQRATQKMVSMGYPVMCAISRKRFIGAISGIHEAEARDIATIGAAIAAAEAGARILRVHDVAGLAQALAGYWAVRHPDPRRAFVALGSNVGDRLAYLGKAVALINQIPLTCVVGVSHAYESDPAYGIATKVANCVVEVRSELAPMVLLDSLLEVENQLGRQRPVGMDGHGPRTIDCDLVWMEGETHAGSRLSLPHPGLGERDFVLVPMEDLMHDPKRFLTHSGVTVVPDEERVGRIRSDLGEVTWQ